jgi:hypothetical protein
MMVSERPPAAGYQRLDLPGPGGRPPSSPAAPERTSTQWCLTVSVITFLCAISLIGVSEGWLETMGLGHRVAHDKDCSSPKFTKQTLKLLAEEPVQRLASVKGAGGEVPPPPSQLADLSTPFRLAELTPRFFVPALLPLILGRQG